MVSSVVTPQKWKKKLPPNRYLTELSSQSLVSFLVQALNVFTLYWKIIKEGMVDKPMIEHLMYHRAWKHSSIAFGVQRNTLHIHLAHP